MKVLIWCPVINPGGGLYLLSQLAAGLQRNAVVTKLRVAVNAASPFLGDLVALLRPAVEIGQIHDISSAMGKAQRLWGIRGTGRLKMMLSTRRVVFDVKKTALKQLRAQADQFDLVYVIWPHHAEFPDLDQPIVCTFQDSTMFDFPEILGGAHTHAEWQRSQAWIERSARVVVSSHASEAALQRHFGAHVQPSVIHHAIYPHAQSVPDAAPDVRLPPKYVICPTNVTPHKNLDTLLIAWSRFERRHEYPLVVKPNCTGWSIGSACGVSKTSTGWAMCRMRRSCP